MQVELLYSTADFCRDSSRKAARKFSVGIDDLPVLLGNAVEASLKNLDSLKQATHDKAVRLTRLAEKLLYTEEGNATADPQDVHAIKFGLVNVRQFQVGALIITLMHCVNRVS